MLVLSSKKLWKLELAAESTFRNSEYLKQLNMVLLTADQLPVANIYLAVWYMCSHCSLQVLSCTITHSISFFLMLPPTLTLSLYVVTVSTPNDVIFCSIPCCPQVFMLFSVSAICCWLPLPLWSCWFWFLFVSRFPVLNGCLVSSCRLLLFCLNGSVSRPILISF